MAALLERLRVNLDDPGTQWQNHILAIALTVSMFESYVSSRQLPYLSPTLHPSISPLLLPYLPTSDSHSNTYSASQAYSRAKLRYSSLLGKLDLLESFLLLTAILAPIWSWSALHLGSEQVKTGSFPYFTSSNGDWTLLRGFWDLAARLLPYPEWQQSELKQSLAFAAVMTTVGTVLSLPKEWWSTFKLEEEHGFNKTTGRTFLLDQLKSYILTLALELPILAGILKIIERVGSEGVLQIVAWLMLFIFAFQLVMIPLYPYLIAPLFNTFTPLPPTSPVYPLVRSLSTRLNFPLGRVWVMDGSKRSGHSNAFFFGIPGMTKHIVIYDTLLEKSNPEEVEAILAHELGHWHHSHVLVLLLTSLLQTAFSLLTFSLFLGNQSLLASFGFTTTASSGGGGPQTIISLLLAATLFAPLSSLLKFATNGVTRRLEYQADEFAARLDLDDNDGEGVATTKEKDAAEEEKKGGGPVRGKMAANLKKALVGIHEKNLALTSTDWLYSMYHNNHPTLIERLEALDKVVAVERKGKGQGKGMVEGKKDL